MLLIRNPAGAEAKMCEPAEARSAEMQAVFENIKGDFLLAQYFGDRLGRARGLLFRSEEISASVGE